ncbi:class II aldolase/adducin family protein [Listeria costaricensis]|uniref:class II aldolase/adducin family protein n=1 Tax=Listeria costaricensis TaxID=2026604 RepID=UPI000C06BB46|nr:class II aldolase/adducin family protein [Listeria costaricensis]
MMEIEQMRQLGAYLAEKQLLFGQAGNLSQRIGQCEYVITASGTSIGHLAPADFAHCQIGGKQIAGAKPSKEAPMHEAIYTARPDCQAVIHAAPFYSTLLACCEEIPPLDGYFVEAMYYLENMSVVPYRHPGSIELAKEVGCRAEKTNVLLLQNHGVLVYGKTGEEALVTLETLEMAAKMQVLSKGRIASLAPAVIADFRENAGYKPRRRWPQ